MYTRLIQQFYTSSDPDFNLTEINISQEDVLKKLKLNTDKSAGLDGLHPKVLYEARIYIVYLLYKSLYEVREAICYPFRF